MAAITWSHPEPHIGPARPSRPHLRLVAPPRRPPAHIYRRRRLVAAFLLTAVLLGAALMAGALVPGSSATARPAAPPAAGARVHVVQPGDTVWSIARSVQPDGDVRPLVDRLVADHGGMLRVGQRIVFPA
jgi:hypothetical protein